MSILLENTRNGKRKIDYEADIDVISASSGTVQIILDNLIGDYDHMEINISKPLVRSIFQNMQNMKVDFELSDQPLPTSVLKQFITLEDLDKIPFVGS